MAPSRTNGSRLLLAAVALTAFTVTASLLYGIPFTSLRPAAVDTEWSLMKADKPTSSLSSAEAITGCTVNATIAPPTTTMTTTATTTTSNAKSTTIIPVGTKLLQQFASIMNDSERRIMATMLGRLTDMMDAANLTYHMCGGTLIGSYRHHGMIPWDDDVDIYARWVENRRLEKEVKRRLSKEYTLVKARARWKLYSKRQSVVIPGWRWNYPFIDICFVRENDSWVWDYDNDYSPKFSYRRSTVYPLRRRPFMNMSLWAPNDVETYLRTTYDIDKCKSNVYIHKHEIRAKQVHSTNCRRLWPYFPFVFRSKMTPSPDSQMAGVEEAVEELKIGDRVISKFVVRHQV